MIKRGFTLIELLVVVSIILIVMGTIFVMVDPIGIQRRSRDARRKADLEAIRQALELYRADNSGLYPITGGWVGSGSGGDWIGGLVPDFISRLPVDSINNVGNPGPCWNREGYRYNYTSIDGSSYILTAIMEQESSDDESKCDELPNWDPTNWRFGCTAGDTWNDPSNDVCYGVQNP